MFVWQHHGSDYGLQFFAGWLTEYSLSVDNLFIFLIIMASFRVPRARQQEALLVGIVLALVFRAVFIGLGAVAIAQFSWIFYLFGLFLIYTAAKLIKDTDHEDDAENAIVRLVRRHYRLADHWEGGLKLFVKENGVRLLTPMALVIVALGTTDVLFALGLDPGDLRTHQRAVPGADGEHLRAHGPAPAVLPARRPAEATRLPVAGPGDPACLHRREAPSARPA